MSGNDKMISRRQIIRCQQEPAVSRETQHPALLRQHQHQQQPQQTMSGASSSGSAQQSSAGSGGGSSNKSSSGAGGRQQAQQQARGLQQPPATTSGRKQLAAADEHQDGSSDGYLATTAGSNQYEDYAPDLQQHAPDYWSRGGRQGPASGAGGHHQAAHSNYRHFDPYSIYAEEEEVWYSEERLFEDHLEEIFNKWRLLDDDIWCKLIIMERNRRIGKAYARVPVVTIDGSHELSYDGQKLALNGFDNPDRDAKTEECRRRIGKGIRIKMDNFGNILIKRLSKSGVYIKEWLQPGGGSASSHPASNNSNVMPSRQQLIKNQNAMLAATMNNRGAGGGSQISSLNTSVTPSSSSAGSSMDPSNDSAICDEVISVGGRLDQDKIYVMFDMKKFQANITQELCRPYPDKRKLEQQCFSIVGLARDSNDVLNLPCWVMVINIVAIEMLNERFPLMMSRAGFPDTMLQEVGGHHQRARDGSQAPNFISIFEQNNNNERSSKDSASGSKEEDPYSLPANASSSDVKSSINDNYGTTSTKNMNAALMDSNGHQIISSSSSSSRYYGASKRAEMYAHKKEQSRNCENPMLESAKHRSKSNCNIYGPGLKPIHQGSRYGSHHNNSSSIYSPGHMLVPPSGDSVPPKLPPRDFVKKGKSKSSSNVNYEGSQLSRQKHHHQTEVDNIYSVGSQQQHEQHQPPTTVDASGKARKTKKNRFLESLKAPLELAKSSNKSSASMVGAPAQSTPVNEPLDKKVPSSGKSKGGFTKSGAKNLKSLLGVKGGGSRAKDTISDDSNYVHVDSDITPIKGTTRVSTSSDGVEVDSVVDSQEDESNHQVASNSSSSASYNDLDIPTPDYETDENIYALESGYNRGGGFAASTANHPNMNKNNKGQHDNRRSCVNGSSKNPKGSNNNNKEDLYYSGYRAHVPQNIGSNVSGGGDGMTVSRNGKSLLDDKMSCLSSREGSRFAVHNKTMLGGSKMSGRDMIYGSTTGLTSSSSMAGSRYRSASMQRYYPSRAQAASAAAAAAARSHAEMYDPEMENPYAMSGGVDLQSQYGVTPGAGGGHRRRVGSKLTVPFDVNHGGSALNRVASSMANSNYDIGRSSSGIYGNNSSSSSSDYADWHPQMRKVNSSGYLNSIFKNHTTASPVDTFNPIGTLNNGNPSMAGYGYNTGKQNHHQRNYPPRTLKSARPASSLSKQQQQQQQQHQQQQQNHQVPSSRTNGPNYRSYDSSNDSEPSYTNSSDGLDIYDHIGAHARLNHHHFLNMQGVHNIAPEVHVGEWENMYDR